MFGQETIYAMNNPVPAEKGQECSVCESPIVAFYLDGNLDKVCEACWGYGNECNEPAPATIEFYSTHFGGESRAKCTECKFVSAYWECGCELEHNCSEWQ